MSEHPVEIADTRHVAVANDPDRFRLGHGYKELPFDLPVMVEVKRHLKDGGDGVKGLVGWEMELDVLSRGKVQVKIIKGAGMAVLVDGAVVWRSPKG